jgi:hypothetical protein
MTTTTTLSTRDIDGATIEYVSIRRPAPAGSGSATGYVTDYGWRPAGSRRRSLMTSAEAAAAVRDDGPELTDRMREHFAAFAPLDLHRVRVLRDVKRRSGNVIAPAGYSRTASTRTTSAWWPRVAFHASASCAMSDHERPADPAAGAPR